MNSLFAKALPYLAAAAIATGVFYKVWDMGGDHIQAKWDKATTEQVAVQLAKNQADQTKLTKLEETKNENIVEINRLRANNHALWLRLPRSTCTGSQTSGDTTAGGGQLPEGAPSGAEAAINAFDKRWAEEAYRADRIVEDCRVLNDFLRGNP